jgi:tetratricopeptide (TPR) repeat protein
MRAFVLRTFCALVLVPASIFAGEALAQQRYTIKQDEPTTGSHIRREQIISSLPLDKRYSELTNEQRNAVKSQYEQMAEDDEPPFPVNGLGPVYKAISEIHKKIVLRDRYGLGVSGPLAMHIQVDSQGNATSVSVYQSPDPEMTKSAATIAMLTRYKPAMCGGQPCAMVFPVRMQLCGSSLSGCGSDPQDASAYYNRGNAWSRKGDYDRAIADFNEAIRLDPQDASAYYNRGNAWSKKGEHDRAIADFTEAIRFDARKAEAYYNRGLAWSRKGDNDRAIADYNDAIQADPKYALAYNNRGNAWHRTGDDDKAIADYDEAIRLNPQDALFYGNRGSAWSGKGEHDRAIGDYDEAIRLDPKYSRAYLHRGYAQFCLGQYDASLQDVTESLRLNVNVNLNPSYAMIWRYLAQARGGKPEVAMSEFLAKLGTLDQTKWPAPVVDLLAGKSAPDALLKAAEHPDTDIRRDQVCEAEFYVGEWHLLNLRLTEARGLLSRAEKNCPTTTVEYGAAVAELKRMPR